jgi:leader peptidase (prepilin peptidase)/N-methyltransferase
VICVLFTISFIDVKTHKIPDVLVIAVAALGVVSIWVYPEIGISYRVEGVAVAGILLLVAVMAEGAFGGGDIKLMAAVGFLLGFRGALIAAFISLFAAGIYCGATLLFHLKKQEDEFAFGPCLCAGTLIAMFTGNYI